MSVRMGDYYIKVSSTVALNSIRKDEELEKGWRKNEIHLPAEFRDLDPVFVIPLKRVEHFCKEIVRIYITLRRLIWKTCS